MIPLNYYSFIYIYSQKLLKLQSQINREICQSYFSKPYQKKVNIFIIATNFQPYQSAKLKVGVFSGPGILKLLKDGDLMKKQRKLLEKMPKEFLKT